MKNLGAAAGILLGLTSTVWSAQDVKSVSVQLTVLERQDMILDRTSLSFAEPRPGAPMRGPALEVDAGSNSGAGWGVFLKADPLTHADCVTQIPAESFRYFLAGAAPVLRTEDRGVPARETRVYETGPGSPSARLRFGFKVSAPEGQKPGRYSTTLHVMMVDNL